MKVVLTPKAQKAFTRLPKAEQSRVAKTIDSLEVNPFPRDSVKLTDQPGYRIRVGRFRVLYLVDRKTKTLVIARIAHRREAYRKISF